MKPATKLHLLSGGLDSVVMLYDMVHQGMVPHCLLFDYRQRHVQELIWAKHHVHRLKLMFTTMELPQLRGSELTDGSRGVIVPNRNAIMLSLAVNLAVSLNIGEVTYACNKDDEAMFPDCRMAFVQMFNTMLTTAEIPVEVVTPYMTKSKAWIAAHGQELGVKFDETWSCYAGGIDHCGECPACIKRKEAIASCA